MTSLTEPFDRFLTNLAKSVGTQVITDGGTAEDGRAAEEGARFYLGLDSLDTGSSSSTSSASSPQSSRSGTSSRSLRGLSKTWLVACLPALLVGASAQIQPLLARGIFGDGSNGRTTP